jgi:putative membrane-bound dehydrogenase-like protein
VIVTLAGRVAFMKDTSGDGRADVDETWFTGFAEENTQLRANHPRLALDNHVTIANGLRGGTVVDARRPDAKPVSISGMDFRFDPLTGESEAVSGVGQFGLTFDDFGNRFVCSNRNPAIHIVLEDRHLKKNPLVAAAAVTHDVARAGESSRVFPIGQVWTTSNLHAGQFTAACGVEVYRGDALPGEYRGNLFICEPTGHLVHREMMKPLGVTFASTPAEEGKEFLASRDPWFSPVNLEIGPDGALYVVDMYRAVIEHPDWMPEELRQRPDLREGSDRGRIYRIVPQDFRRPVGPRLSSKSSEELVELLAHPNAWWRGTAARLLLERQDKTIAEKLRAMALRHASPLARIHALWLLDGLGEMSDDVLLGALGDSDPRVIEQAIIVGESRIGSSDALRAKIAVLVHHADARVRFQALLVATPLPGVPAQAADPWELQAMLIAAGNRGAAVLADVLRNPAALEANVSDPRRFVADLAGLAAAAGDDRQTTRAIEALVESEKYGRAGLIRLLAEFHGDGRGWNELLSTLSEDTRRKLEELVKDSRRVAVDGSQTDAARCQAIDLIVFADDASDVIVPLALGEPSQPVRLRAIAGLARSGDLAPWRQLLESFANESPALQTAILDGALSDAERTSLLLDAVAAGYIKPSQIDTTRTTRLLKHADSAISARSKALLADAIPADRQQVLAEYQAVLTMPADPERGRAVFSKQCASCHQIGSVGIRFAPDISDSREKSPAQLLTDIIQPNRAIDANYFSYTAVTGEGVTHTGVLAAETSTSITLNQAEGKSITLRRAEIDELYSNGVSLMPDGVERLIPPQDMADLISFVKNWRYIDDSQNQVAPVR